MEFKIYSEAMEDYVGLGLSRGELNQWLLDSCEEFKWPSPDFFEWFVYDYLDDMKVLGKWDTRNGRLIVEEDT